jgi:hypothetical protein
VSIRGESLTRTKVLVVLPTVLLESTSAFAQTLFSTAFRAAKRRSTKLDAQRLEMEGQNVRCSANFSCSTNSMPKSD